MAVYVNNSRYVQDPTKAGGAGDGVVMDYMVDTLVDIAKLPDNTKIKETSTAYIIPTGQRKQECNGRKISSEHSEKTL